MTIKPTIILVLLLYNLSLFSQNSTTALEVYDSITNNGPTALDCYKKKHILDSILLYNKAIKNPNRFANILYDFSKEFYRKDYNISLNYALKVDSIGKSINKTREEFYPKNARNLIILHNKKGLYRNAISYGKKYLKLFIKETKEHTSVYRNLGNAYDDNGNLNEAIFHYEKALFLSKKYNSLKDEAKTATNLIGVFVKLKDTLYKDRFYNIISRIKNPNLDSIYKSDIELNAKKELNIGGYFDILEDFTNAKKHYAESLKLSKETSDSLNIFKSLINIAIVNRRIGNYDKAREVFKEASHFTNNNIEKQASLYNNMADLYKDEQNLNEALKYYNKAISSILDLPDTNIINIPKSDDIPLHINKVDLQSYITDKANLLSLMSSTSSQDLEYTLELYNTADNILDAIYYESQENLSKLFWREQAANLYLNAVDIAYKLNKPEKAFYYIEKSKALLLLENITNSKAKELANLPKHIIDREYTLLQNIKNNNNTLLDLNKDSKNSLLIDNIKNETFKYKQEYSNFIDSLELKYPTYYKYKSKVTVFDAKMAQQNIKNDEIILNYIYSKNKGYVSVVDKNNIAVYQLKDLENLKTNLKLFKTLISRPFTNTNDSNQFKIVSNTIFESLFPFDNNISLLKDKKVIIILGESLQGIPFESLVTETKKQLNSSYLLNTCEISYAYSYSSLKKLSKTSYNFEKNVFAINPVEFKTQNLPLLSIPKEDSKKLENLLSTSLIEKQEANKANFINAYGNYKIIHISTHGGVENNRAWLAFNDDKLMFDEIYFKEKKAEMVILSACKTSQGELKKGEGIMSIAREFTNAGAQSIVSSLWDLNQKSSNEIIFEFYKNLNNNVSKSTALKNAKLAYLEKHKNTSEASPYYWSSIILTGSNTPIAFKNNNYLYLIIVGFLLISLIIFFFIRRQKRKTID